MGFAPSHPPRQTPGRPSGRRRGNRSRQGVRALLLAGGLLLGTAGAAHAHQPLFVTADDPDPASGPLIEDGTVSFAVYGTLDEADATRGVRSRLKVGDPLIAEMLIPARNPEQSMPTDELPTVTVTWPDGTERTLPSDVRVRFDEPFSQTSYFRIAELRDTVTTPGVYEFTITGPAPARFTFVTGITEGIPGTVTGAEPAPEGGLQGWYTTPPPKAATTTTAATTPSSAAPADDSSGSEPSDTGADDEDERAANPGRLVIPIVAGIVVALAVGVVVARRRRPRG